MREIIEISEDFIDVLLLHFHLEENVFLMFVGVIDEDFRILTLILRFLLFLFLVTIIEIEMQGHERETETEIGEIEKGGRRIGIETEEETEKKKKGVGLSPVCQSIPPFQLNHFSLLLLLSDTGEMTK